MKFSTLKFLFAVGTLLTILAFFYDLFSHHPAAVVFFMLRNPNSIDTLMLYWKCPVAQFIKEYYFLLAGADFVLVLTTVVVRPLPGSEPGAFPGYRNVPLAMLLLTSVDNSSPNFFSRALFSPLASLHQQTYYSLTVYFFLAFALCGLLAGLAYLFSISTAQETEKRSEYECGFAPFDSATRLPFDVHFYLVGILFLIFDVEVALLFPWVLTLRTTGWFGFYLMFAFLAILTLGFLYEWKRGALIWPTRYSKKNFSPLLAASFSLQGETVQELITIGSSHLGVTVLSISALFHLGLLYNMINRSTTLERRVPYLVILWHIWAAPMFYFFYHQSCLFELMFAVTIISYYLEGNPFWPTRGYWASQILLFSSPTRLSDDPYSPYKPLKWFWSRVLVVFMVFYTQGVIASGYKLPEMITPIGVLRTLVFRTWRDVLQDLGAIVWKFLCTIPKGLEYACAYFFVPAFEFINELTVQWFPHYDLFIYSVIAWVAASVAFSYTHGWFSFSLFGIHFKKEAGEPSVSANMRYLWVEASLTAVILVVAAALAYVYGLWNAYPYFIDAFLIGARQDIIWAYQDLVAFTLAAPGRLQNAVHTGLHAVADYGAWAINELWTVYLKPLPSLLWRFKYLSLWLLFIVRGYRFYCFPGSTGIYYTWFDRYVEYMSLLMYVYIIFFFDVYHFIVTRYKYAKAYCEAFYAKYRGESPAQLTATAEDEKGPLGGDEAGKAATIVVVSSNGNPTGKTYEEALNAMAEQQSLLDAFTPMYNATRNSVDELTCVKLALSFAALALLCRYVQLSILWITRTPIPDTAPADLVEKFAWKPKKASGRALLYAICCEESIKPPLVTFIKELLYLILERPPEPVKEEVTYFVDNSPELMLSVLDRARQLELITLQQADLFFAVTTLTLCCIFLFSGSCYLSRACQHHYTQLDSILTYGALVVVPSEDDKKPAAKAKKALLLLVGESAGDLLSPASTELISTPISETPLLVEGLLFLLICAVITKLSSALGKEHSKRFLAYASWRALTAGLFVLLFVYLLQFIFDSGAETILGGYFATSRTITLLKLVTLASVVFVLDGSETFMRQHSRHLLEYPIMVALTTFFMLLLISANHVMSTFLSLVGFSLGLYVLILYDANRRPSREAGLKYYYLSTLSSGFILYGILLIYTLTGTGAFDELFLLLNTRPYFHENTLLRTALLLALVGFFFKLSAFPGHLWAADVYEGSPAPVTAFFMLPVKIVVLGAFIRLFSVALAPLAAYWLPLLTLAVIISIIWGALASVQEKKVRRFLAYASINQMGFLLMGLTTDSDEGYQAALLYILVYAVMTCAFLTIFLSARREDGSELLYMSDFRTLASRNWLVGWSLAIVLFSMAGIPPLGGFFAKYFVLLHAFEKGLFVEVIVGLATSLISTYYYLRIIKIVKFEQPDGAMPASPCLTSRRQGQLFIAEALLWAFIVFAPAILSLTYSLALI